MKNFAAAVFAASVACLPLHAQEATATFVAVQGAASGTAEFSQAGDGILVRIEAAGLPPAQWVALHVHGNGVCDQATGHEEAGGHFNPSSAEHGYSSPSGPHAGDMPNIWVDAEGVGRAQFFSPLITLDDGENAVRGKALMIHAQADDYISQPSGNSGDRIACAVIE